MRTSDTEGKGAFLFADTNPILVSCECNQNEPAGNGDVEGPLICKKCGEEIFYRSWCSW